MTTQAAGLIAGAASKLTDDGMTLWFFSDGAPVRNAGIKEEKDVAAAFAKTKPRMRYASACVVVDLLCDADGCLAEGGTDLAGALDAVFKEHFGDGKSAPTATSVLVITDGAPSSRNDAEASLHAALGKVKSVFDVTLSFLQVHLLLHSAFPSSPVFSCCAVLADCRLARTRARPSSLTTSTTTSTASACLVPCACSPLVLLANPGRARVARRIDIIDAVSFAALTLSKASFTTMVRSSVSK